MINNLLEIARWVGAGIGLFLAYYRQGDPTDQLDVLCIWMVVSIAGLTGIESVFFGKHAREQSGYGGGAGYQRQSGFNNLALALTTILAYLWGWPLEAKAALLTVLLVFLTLSGANHAYSAMKEGNLKPKNVARPVMTAILLAMTIPFLVTAL